MLTDENLRFYNGYYKWEEKAQSMINGIYLSTMGAMVQSSKHGVIANNLANSNTTGYKPEIATFRELLAESALQPGSRPEINKLLEKTGGGAWLNETATSFMSGPQRQTGNPINAAIKEENGFFEVMKDGQRFYTRDGSFTQDYLGRLVMADGITLVLDNSGSPITLTGSPEITQTGSIVDVETMNVIGQLGLVTADDTSKLMKVGDNLYKQGEATLTSEELFLQPRSVEGSAVNPVREMVAMIEAARAYQANMKMITIQDDTLGQTVSRVGSVSV
ncbi:MAG: flagellar hook-basal body protein [Planctomycetes bacterium]|nr:flagellar hook-basal body protein [Planctomycetota bacterium]